MNKKRTLLALAAWCVLTSAMAFDGVTNEQKEQNTPAGWTAVDLPQLPAITSANTLTVTDYGASADAADNTLAIQKALDAVPDGGGMVVVPAGTWMCGPLKLKSKTVLHLAKGATLKLLPLGTYPGSEGYLTNYSKKVTLDNFIDVEKDATDIIIEGEDSATSVIDGQGAPWWELRDKGGNYKTAFDNMKRGALIRFTSGARFLVRNMKFLNAPGVNVCLGQSGKGSDFTVHDIQIIAPASTVKYKAGNAVNPSHNTDGIPMWARNINIYDCYISTGDDNVVVDSYGQYVHVWNCTFGSGHGASIGSYTTNVHDILYEDIDFNGTESGFKIKSQRGRSGSVYNITFRDSRLNGVQGNPVALDCWYNDKKTTPQTAQKQDSVRLTPYYHDILVQNIKSTGTKYKSSTRDNFPVFIFGLPESHVRNVTFDNVQIEAQKGMFLAYADNIKFINGCKITNSRTKDKLIETQYEAKTSGSYDGTETTAIDAVGNDSSKKTGSGVRYDLSGRRISKDAKGVYIEDAHVKIAKAN